MKISVKKVVVAAICLVSAIVVSVLLQPRGEPESLVVEGIPVDVEIEKFSVKGTHTRVARFSIASVRGRFVLNVLGRPDVESQVRAGKTIKFRVAKNDYLRMDDGVSVGVELLPQDQR
ncbi:MAG: hypothetical protein REI94_08290 [Moraxellaceae bacterium]|nr:hypothetical protein [Moraxellaceae bacterium]